MHYRLNDHTVINWQEPKWKKAARRLTVAALLCVLAFGVLSGCSLGPRTLDPNLDAPRNPENVEIIEHSTYVLPANVHCTYLFFDRGHTGAGIALIAGTAVGGVAFGCATVTDVPPRKPMRVDADQIAMVQSEQCTKETCRCEIYYMGWSDVSNPVYHDEYMHCLGYIDQHPKVDKLAYNERLFERDQDR